MNEQDTLLKQALQTYERLLRKLEAAQKQQRKMPKRATRTTAFAAFQGRIDRLGTMKNSAFARYNRRKERFK